MKSPCLVEIEDFLRLQKGNASYLIERLIDFIVTFVL